METIVIQETDPDVLEILYAALEMEGFRVYALPEADPDYLDIIEKARPHVVILDYRLNGEVCKQLCSQIKARYPYLPVVAMSCNSNIHEVYDRYGFNDYLSKPFDLEHLYRVLRKYVSGEKAIL
ncbi:response regulator [Mucilaginibacter sp. SMC90]|uniref:response regulator n=1 Tax=Mucilaginibacter sp. SMC90 TaxID=2929803 RepID=UPI001FB41ABF|nr:response regulator [Mucilaginibacter sp. SMC90]UOE47935.1 response regulator [Mucilaginibacter sp. SMC90]